MNPVYITRLAKAFPNEAVGNEEMEEIIGLVGGKLSRAKAVVLRNNGIKSRYYARKDGFPTHTNAGLAAQAIRELFNQDHPIEKLEMLAAGTSSPEQLLPSHAAMVHAELGIQPLEIISASGACASSMQALKYAYMAIGCGLVKMAAATGSERSSAWFHASRYEREAETWKDMDSNPFLAFEKDFLRFMLSDGAGAALLEPQPAGAGISLRIEWIEIISYASELETCMYAGAIKNPDASLTGWADVDAVEWHNQSVFAVKQDTRLLAEHVVPRGAMFMRRLMEKHGIGSSDVDWYLPHMSSVFFRQQIAAQHSEIGMEIPFDKWFYNLPDVGNVGSASPFLMLEELMRSGRIVKGQRLLVMVPESARFTYAYMYLTAV